MRNEGLGSWTARRARMSPQRVALVHEGRRTSYARLHERVLRLAAALRARGVQPGDRVAYLGLNHPAFLETLFATTAVGAVFVPVNFRLTPQEVAYALSDSGARVLVHADSHQQIVDEVRGQVPASSFLAVGGASDGSSEPFDAVLAASEPVPVDEPVALHDPAMILYTSGTTGRPKGAVLTHANVSWNMVNVLVDTDLRHDEVSLVCAPLFHVAALNMICLPTLVKGGTVILMSSFDAESVLEHIEREGVTCIFGVPTMFDRIAASGRWGTADLSGLRTVMCGGAPVPLRTISTYLDRGVVFLQGYGMTETSPGALFLDAEHAHSKAGSAGVPSFFTDVRVVRPDGTEVEPGERGEVVVSGPNVMAGYWLQPESTQAAVRDGWFHSGDVAVVDADGYVRIVDRIKDMIVSGGENIYPAEVEEALFSHPDVAECAVIGVPDDEWGEVGRAIVVPRPGSKPTAEELLAHLGGRLARYKIPKSIVFVEQLPRTGAGKVLKTRLRADYGGR
jgi:fatty-acyl-CoA synthase